MNTVVALPRLAVYAAASMLLIAAAYSHAQTGAKRVRVSIPGANVTYLPMFGLGIKGMPRWVVTYPAGAGFSALSLISSIGAGVIGLAMMAFLYNIYISARQKKPATADPWGGHSLEWLTSSPPPRFNYNAQFPIPRIRSFTPALDLRERQRERQRVTPSQRAGRPVTVTTDTRAYRDER